MTCADDPSDGTDARQFIDYLEANEGESFAGALAAVLAGRAEGIGARGRTLVERHYSIEALARLLGSFDAEAA